MTELDAIKIALKEVTDEMQIAQLTGSPDVVWDKLPQWHNRLRPLSKKHLELQNSGSPVGR